MQSHVEKLRVFALPMPETCEQVAIARVLDAVDMAIERARRMPLARSRELDHSLLHDLLEIGVNQGRKLKNVRAHWTAKKRWMRSPMLAPV